MRDQPPTPDVELESAPRPNLAPPSGRVRAAATLVLAACLSIIGIAAYLKPNARGMGTHEQLFPGPCGMLLTTGMPCPTCGMTTAFAYTVRGQWVMAIWAQPVGWLLCLGTIALAGVSALAAIRGRWPRVLFIERHALGLMVAFLVIFFAGWGFKIAVGLSDGTLPWKR